MKIKTTMLFKLRRFSSCAEEILPEFSEKSKQRLLTRLRLLNSDKMEREILNSCIVLKNLAVVHRQMPMSADFMLEQLMQSSRTLRNVYADILSAYRNGKGEEAFDIFYERIPIKQARNFSFVLSKIDKINPAELSAQMTAFEETFAGERMTKGLDRAEKKSVITTIAATSAIFAVLLNFAGVVVFMDTLQTLRQIF